MKSKNIPIPIYNSTLYVYYPKNIKDVLKLKKKYNLNYNFSEDKISFQGKTSGTLATTFSMSGYHIIIYYRKPSPTTIAHECFHVVFDLLQQRGLVLTNSSDEAYAYLIGYLVGQHK